MEKLLKYVFVLFLSVQIQAQNGNQIQTKAQQRTITGIVTSAYDQLPLPGASVTVLGTSKGVSTDFDGKYKITVKEGSTLEFKSLGFTTQKIKVIKQNVISVALKEDINTLDEVVVVGYGVRKRSYVTGSVSRVSSKAISRKKARRNKQESYHSKIANQMQSSTVEDALQGQVSGVKIKSERDTKIKIRGVGSISGSQNPIVVIDGKIASYDKLEKMNPKNLKSVDVLKDASSTAIYGSRGSNGVILISTKNAVNDTQKEPLYIIDGVPLKKENNHIAENLPKAEIKNRKEYKGEKAKKKYGKVAKNGCIVITTNQGGFKVNNNESYAIIEENNFERTASSPLSTFSIDVDKASYSNVRRMINSTTNRRTSFFN